MKTRFTFAETVTLVPGLTEGRLERFLSAEIVRPVRGAGEDADGWFAPLDLARLELACELCEGFDMEEDALGLVLDLIDRLQRTAADLRALTAAVACQPEPVRRAILAALRPQA